MRGIRNRIAIVLAVSLGAAALFAQDATQPTVDLGPHDETTPEPAVNPEEVPELSELDRAFKETSLGTAADEYRTRVAWRKLQNQMANDTEVIEAKRAAEMAPTDLEKRHRLRDYYEIYYGKMRARADTPELRTALEGFKNDHLRPLAQPRVRPNEMEGLPTPSATPKNKDKKNKDKKKKQHGGLSKFAPQS